MSFLTSLNDSITFAPRPTLPCATANKLADVTFLTCVIGDRIVLAY